MLNSLTPTLSKVIKYMLLLCCLVNLTGCLTGFALSEEPTSKVYDQYKTTEILSVAVVTKNQIKHSASSIRTIFNAHKLENSGNYLAICISGKEKVTGVKKYTFYGLLPNIENIKKYNHYEFSYLSVAPGCYKYDKMENKKIKILESMGKHPYRKGPNLEEFRFNSNIYGKNMLYLILIYSGPSYSTKINYLYYPLLLGAIVIDIVTLPLQGLILGTLAILLRDMGPI